MASGRCRCTASSWARSKNPCRALFSRPSAGTYHERSGPMKRLKFSEDRSPTPSARWRPPPPWAMSAGSSGSANGGGAREYSSSLLPLPPLTAEPDHAEYDHPFLKQSSPSNQLHCEPAKECAADQLPGYLIERLPRSLDQERAQRRAQ